MTVSRQSSIAYATMIVALATAPLPVGFTNSARAAVINYNNNDNNASTVTIADNTTQLQITTGSATQTGVVAESGGSRPLEKIGAGTLTFAGSNTYTGTTTITAGTLQIGNGGTTGTLGSGNVTDNATLIFNRSDNITVANTISGTGSLTKNGAGLLILNGVNTFTGNTSVNAGTLSVGGDSTRTTAQLLGTTTVNTGATLKGVGTLGAIVNASGNVAPGNSIGTLKAASFTQNVNGTLTLEVAPTTADKLAVTGTASLNGTLSLVFAPGTYTTTTFNLISAASITGKFATVNSNVASQQLAQALTINSTTLALTVGNGTATPGTATFAVVPTNHTVFAAADSTSIENGQSADMTFLDRAQDRNSGDSDARWGAADNLIFAAQGQGPLSGASVWMRGRNSKITADASSTAPAFKTTANGFMAGLDWSVRNNMTLGFGAGFDQSSISESSKSQSDVTAYRAGAYGSYEDGPLSVDATINAAADQFKARRIVGKIAKSHHDGGELGGALRINYAIAASSFTLVPNIGVFANRLHENGFTETHAGAFNLVVKSQSLNSVRPFAGLTLKRAFTTDEGTKITPHISVIYTSELNDETRDTAVTAADGTGFTANGVAPGKSAYDFGAGLDIAASDDFTFYADYDRHSASKLKANTFSLGLRYTF